MSKEGNYQIRASLNCRCFGKLSGKNVVVPRLILWDTTQKKIIPSKPGLELESSFWGGDQKFNQLEISLIPGTYSLIVATDNSAKGGPISTVQNCGASSTIATPLVYDISAAPTGKVDLIINEKAPKVGQ